MRLVQSPGPKQSDEVSIVAERSRSANADEVCWTVAHTVRSSSQGSAHSPWLHSRRCVRRALVQRPSLEEGVCGELLSLHPQRTALIPQSVEAMLYRGQVHALCVPLLGPRTSSCCSSLAAEIRSSQFEFDEDDAPASVPVRHTPGDREGSSESLHHAGSVTWAVHVCGRLVRAVGVELGGDCWVH